MPGLAARCWGWSRTRDWPPLSAVPALSSAGTWPIAEPAGVAKLRIDDDSEASRLVLNGDDPKEGIVEVPCAPLRAYLADNAIAAADLLKIDIEGAELAIFEGEDFDVLPRMKQISVEFHAFLYPEQRPRVKNIISKMNKSGFYSIDFSATWKDVLFVNKSMISIGFWEKLALLHHKYATGLPALLRKIYADGLGAVIKKIIARRFSRRGHRRSPGELA